MVNVLDDLDKDVNLGYDKTIIKNLENDGEGTYHYRFKLISEESKRRTKNINLLFRIIGIVFLLTILVGMLDLFDTKKIEYMLLIIFSINILRMFNLRTKELKGKSNIMEEYLKREDRKTICKDEILEKYYSFKDMASEEAIEYRGKYGIIGTYRSLKPQK